MKETGHVPYPGGQEDFEPIGIRVSRQADPSYPRRKLGRIVSRGKRADSVCRKHQRSHTFSRRLVRRKNEHRKSRMYAYVRTCQTKVKPAADTDWTVPSNRISGHAVCRSANRCLWQSGSSLPPRLALVHTWYTWIALKHCSNDGKTPFTGSGPVAELGRSPITGHGTTGPFSRAYARKRTGVRWAESFGGGRRPRIFVIGPGESRLGERRASDWLSHDLPEVPEAIQDPRSPLLSPL